MGDEEKMRELAERYVWAMCQVRALCRALARAPRIPDMMVEVRGPKGERHYLCLSRGYELPESARWVDTSLIVPMK